MDKQTNHSPHQSVHIQPIAVVKKRAKLTDNLGIIIGTGIIILAGIISGGFFASSSGKGTGGAATIISKDGNTVGIEDASVFKDSAEGVLEAGGIDGEGTHRLIRPGGDNQTVYLTSTVIDLDEYVGKKIKIWGETHTAQKAGWFMDIGKLEVL